MWTGAAAFWFVVWAASAGAQSKPNQLAVPTDPVIREQLARAQDALEDGQTDRALRLWQQVLDSRTGRVVPDARSAPGAGETGLTAGDHYRGVRRHVMGRIRSLPPERRARYRELMEPVAKKLLDRGLRSHDETTLRAVAARFFLVPSGRAAYLGLVDLLLGQSRFAEARMTAQRLESEAVEAGAPPQFLARVMARQASALWGAGEHRKLLELADRCQREHARRKVTVAGEAVPVASFAKRLAKAPAPTSRPKKSARARTVRTWRQMFPLNDGSYRDRWSYEPSIPLQETPHFPVVPRLKDGVVFHCDGLFMRAYALRTGREVWAGVATPHDQFVGTQHRDLQYHTVVDGDLVIAYLQGEPMLVHPWRRSGSSVPSHKLVALDRNTGDLRWAHMGFKGKTTEETEFIRLLSVNQPPLAIGDTLYAAGTVFRGIFRHWLCAFERETGHLRWKTYIGAGQTEMGRGGNPFRAPVPTHVTERDGILYYGTNMGVVSAINAVTGTLVWQTAYAQDPPPAGSHRRRRWGASGRSINPRWVPARPIVSGGRVFFGPADAPHLLAADIKTGKLTPLPVASSYQRNDRNQRLVGEHSGRLITAGRNVVALDPATLKLVWVSERLAVSVPVQGRPVIDGDYLVLTRAPRVSEVHWLDLRTGRLQARRPLQGFDCGNLATTRGAVVIAGRGTLVTHAVKGR